MESVDLTGGCLCGAVRFRCSAQPEIVGDCFCIDCRKSSGTAHCTHVMVSADALEVSGDVTFYERAADSGNMVRRGFCGTCGSPLYSTNAGIPHLAFLRASALDDPDLVAPQMTVYASRAPGWAHVDRSRPVFDTMPEAPPAAFAQAT
ncbi:hypothetical protein AB7M35_001125 [Amorphus suaedae]